MKLEDKSGTILGFISPEYIKSGIDYPGSHLHFISDNRTKGGHIYDFMFISENCQISVLPDSYYKALCQKCGSSDNRVMLVRPDSYIESFETAQNIMSTLKNTLRKGEKNETVPVENS